MVKNWTSIVACIYHYVHSHYSCFNKFNFSDNFKLRIKNRKQNLLFVFNLRFLHVSASLSIALRCVSTFRRSCRSLSGSICWILWFTFLHAAMSTGKFKISSLFTPYWYWKTWHCNSSRFYNVNKGWMFIDTICQKITLFFTLVLILKCCLTSYVRFFVTAHIGYHTLCKIVLCRSVFIKLNSKIITSTFLLIWISYLESKYLVCIHQDVGKNIPSQQWLFHTVHYS